MTSALPRDIAVSPSTALFTDHYELTMVQAALRSGAAARRCVFEVFARHLPEGRRYGVVAGTGRVLEAIRDFRFEPEQLAHLRRQKIVDDETVRWLADFHFGGQVLGYGEGECFFPGSPLMVVEGSFAEAVLLETLVLSILNHDSAVAAAASRMAAHAQGRPCLEMGSRRTHEVAAVASARAAYIAGFSATSNLEAGLRYGVPTMGTAAHAFTLLHDSEREAFAAQVAILGPGTTLLVDTFDVAAAVATAVDVAGPALGAVRLASGDLPELAKAVRAQLDDLGATSTQIVVSGDLDEHAIAALAAYPVDAYGAGTQLVTGSGAPTAGMVYKLVAHEDSAGEMVPVAKRSPSKTTLGGRKSAYRRLWPDGVAKAEVIVLTGPDGGHDPQTPAEEDDRPLLTTLIDRGELIGDEPLDEARARHAAALLELPARARRLSRGEPALPTVIVGAGG